MMCRASLLVVAFVLVACSGGGEREEANNDTGSDTDVDLHTDASDATDADVRAPEADVSDAGIDAIPSDADATEADALDGDTSDAADAPDADAGGDDGGITVVPGARLVPEGHALGDLFAQQYIIDRVLDERCDWLPTGDGTYHCVPFGFAEVKYTDEACTDAVLSVREGASTCSATPAPGDIVRAYDGPSCTGQTLVPRQVGEPTTAETLYRRSPVDGTCIADVAAPATLFVAQPPPLDRLVSATVDPRPTGIDGLNVDVLLGSDGSRFRRGLRWTDGTACTAQEAIGFEPEMRPCLPDATAPAADATWADVACSEPVFTVIVDSACPDREAPPWGVVTSRADGCSRPESLVTLADGVSEMYTGEADACFGPTLPPETWRLFSAGAETPMASVPATYLSLQGEGRVRLVASADDESVPRLDSSDWWDTTYDTWCSPRLFSDGSTRCVPADGIGSDGLFADDACTIPAHVVFAGGCNRPADARRIRIEQEFDESVCAPVVISAYALARHTGPVYSEGDGCSEFMLDPSQIALVDAEELGPEDFVELTPTPR